MDDEKIPVSDTDDLTEEGGPRTDKTRRLGDFGKTNSPLSEEEIEARRKLERGHIGEWTPRTTETVHDLEPQPEPPEE